MHTQEVCFEIASDVKGEYPFIREDSFERKLRRHRQRQTELQGQHLVGSAEEARAYFEQVEMEEALRRADLTPRQRAICEHYFAGWNTYEIGKLLKISRQAVCKALRTALLKVKHAWESSPYCGLAEVYHHEVSRVSARPRRG